jgi:GNAT superfamily N-acetyltransferase
MDGDEMFTKDEILQITKAQLALDYNCNLVDFEKDKNVVVENNLIDGRRIYHSDGCFIKILCFGSRIIIKASPLIMPWCEEKLINKSAAWLFQYPKLRAIDEKFNEFGHEIADIHHYYLPNQNVKIISPITKVKWYEYEEILQFKNDDRFEEALGFDEKRPDVLAVAAFEGDNIMGIAGASADSNTMWQIGIDVLPQYRGRGIGTNLVSLLKDETLKRGKVPFYGTVSSHFHSQNIAINAGFYPVWAELFSKTKNSGDNK